MNIGRLRHRISLQQLTERQNHFGAVVSEWQDVAQLWAEIKPISGREQLQNAQIQSEITAQIWLRYRPDVKPTMRVLHQNQQYEIVAALNHQGRSTMLQLLCKEVSDDDGQN